MGATGSSWRRNHVGDRPKIGDRLHKAESNSEELLLFLNNSINAAWAGDTMRQNGCEKTFYGRNSDWTNS